MAVARTVVSAEALETVSSGGQRLLCYDLEQPRRFGDPTFPAHQPGTVFTLHRRHEPGLPERRTSASGMIVTAEHSGTHIDALCHQAYDLKLYGGVAVNATVQTSTGFTRLGVETIAPLVARGVLLDVARHEGVERLPVGFRISRAKLEEVAAKAGVRLQKGDVLLVRTGYGACWRDAATYLAAPGVTADGSQWAAECGVAAVGADNVAWDIPSGVAAETETTLPGHVILLVRAGIHIIENLLLEELAADRCTEFTFVCLPLKVIGGTGCPVRPIALVREAA